MLNVGCHAVLFGEKIKTETAWVIENFAKTGFAGIEVGYRFFGDDVPSLARELKKQGLLLSGFHAGTKMADFLLEPEKTGDFLCHIADKIMEVGDDVMPLKNIVMSSGYTGFNGAAYEGNPNALEEAVRHLNETAAKVKAKGVTINYHNHSHEFANDGAIYKVLHKGAPQMNFGFDLGWVDNGGGDAKAVLKENRGRVSYVHLRDIAAGGKEFADLGQGIADLRGIAALAQEVIGKNGWIVVEYETGEQDFGRYRKAREYLKKIGF